VIVPCAYYPLAHHRHRDRPHAHLLTRGGILRVKPLRHPNLPTDFRHDSQMIQMLHDHLDRHLPAPFG